MGPAPLADLLILAVRGVSIFPVLLGVLQRPDHFLAEKLGQGRDLPARGGAQRGGAEALHAELVEGGAFAEEMVRFFNG